MMGLKIVCDVCGKEIISETETNIGLVINEIKRRKNIGKYKCNSCGNLGESYSEFINNSASSVEAVTKIAEILTKADEYKIVDEKEREEFVKVNLQNVLNKQPITKIEKEISIEE